MQKIAATKTEKIQVSAPLLSDYLCYREFLKDYYLYRRASHTGLRAYSYSVFSAAADIKSPNYLKLIIEGQRNLSPDMTGRFAKALRLNKVESDEFRLLVLYSQESDPLMRNQILRSLADLRVGKQIKAGELDKEKWERVPNWVGWVIYAMADQEGVVFQMELLKELFRGRASENEIRTALKKLIAGGQLVVGSDGVISKGKAVSGADEVPVALVRKLQAELNYLGMESLFEQSAKQREFGALTVALNAEEFEQYRFELRQLRKRIHKEIAGKRETTKGDRVYQLNLQLFPLTESVRNS